MVLLGGAPFDEDIVMWWDFVGRGHDEFVRFREAWRRESERFRRVEGYVGVPMRLPPLARAVSRFSLAGRPRHTRRGRRRGPGTIRRLSQSYPYVGAWESGVTPELTRSGEGDGRGETPLDPGSGKVPCPDDPESEDLLACPADPSFAYELPSKGHCRMNDIAASPPCCPLAVPLAHDGAGRALR